MVDKWPSWLKGAMFKKKYIFQGDYLAFFHVLGPWQRWGGVCGVPWQTVTGGGGELATGQGPAQQIGGRKWIHQDILIKYDT